VLVDEPQQMVFRNFIFQTEVVEHRVGTGVMSHHDEQASRMEMQESMYTISSL
jgi:hypothetical protein